MIKAALFDLFETIVSQYDPDFYQKEQTGIHQVLNMDEELFRMEFANTQYARHVGEIKTRREAFERIAKKHSRSIDRDLLQKYYYESQLPRHVDEILYSYKEKVAKPEKEIYLKALRKLGIPNCESVYIGDGGTQELQGAQSVGIPAYQAFWFLKKYDEEFQNKRLQPFERLYNATDVIKLVEGRL